MCRGWTAFFLAIALAFAFATDADAKTTSRSKKAPAYAKVGATPYRAAFAPRRVRGRVAYAPRSYASPRGRRSGFVDLVGDPYGGYGFYPLPVEVQFRAMRYRQRAYARRWWLNPVLSTIAADAIRTPGFIPADKGYQWGVFNPIDGVGTPFFAGYYR